MIILCWVIQSCFIKGRGAEISSVVDPDPKLLAGSEFGGNHSGSGSWQLRIRNEFEVGISHRYVPQLTLGFKRYTHLARCEEQPVSKYSMFASWLRVREYTHLAGCEKKSVPQNDGQLAEGQRVHSPGWVWGAACSSEWWPAGWGSGSTLGSSDSDIFFEIQYASCVFGLALKS